MARLVRRHAPNARIVLGGHGAAIEGVKDLIDCDHVVQGEGIAWFREFLGQDPSAPIVHPLLPANETQRIFGVTVPGPVDSVLVPGVGGVNGCRFCSTSHFFGKAYTPFLTMESVQGEIDFLVGLEADFVQFMLFTALPVTPLYKDLHVGGTLRKDLPYEEWHGQKHLNYAHAHFPGDAPERILASAFRRDYEVNGSSVCRVVETLIRGYETLSALKNRDACLDARLAQMADKVRESSQLLPLVARYAANERERKRRWRSTGNGWRCLARQIPRNGVGVWGRGYAVRCGPCVGNWLATGYSPERSSHTIVK
jgi:hypothetical protein